MQKAKADANKACALGDCSLKKEIAKRQQENTHPVEEVALVAEEVQGTINE